MGGNMQPSVMMPPNPYVMMNHQRQAMGMHQMQAGGQPETFQMTQAGMPSAVNPQQTPTSNATPPASQNQIGSQQAMALNGALTSGTPILQSNQMPPQQQQQPSQPQQGPPQVQQQPAGQPSQQVANQIAQGLKNSSFSPDMLQVSTAYLCYFFFFCHYFNQIPSYFFLFLKKIVHDPTRTKSYYLIV